MSFFYFEDKMGIFHFTASMNRTLQSGQVNQPKQISGGDP